MSKNLTGSLAIGVEDEYVPWAAAGSNLTLSLVSIDPMQLAVGSMLCSPADSVPLASSFTARILIFDIQVPIIAGAMVKRNQPLLMSIHSIVLVGGTIPSLP